MLKSEFLRKMEDVLEVSSGTISGDENLQSVANWDSMAALTFMSLVDHEFGITLTGNQLQQCRTTSDLIKLLGDRITD